MPIPTDTFWNIKKLNIAFALSGLVLLGLTGLSILQDHHKTWRVAQQDGRVWEAALTQDRIRRIMTPEQEEKLKDLQGFLGELDSAVKSEKIDFNALANKAEAIKKKHDERQKLELAEKQTLDAISQILRDSDKQEQLKKYGQYTDQIKELNSKSETLTFALNNRKSVRNVAESNLQDAKTAGDKDRIAELEKELVSMRERIGREEQQIADWKAEIEKLRKARIDATKPIDDLRKLVGKLTTDVDLLEKKYASLLPQRIDAKLSEKIRSAPLLQFMNPADRVRQVVLPDILTDVSFMKIETIDRCTTCHVHIEKKDFTEPKVLSYLEEQLATSRGVQIPAQQRPEDPSEAAPGALGMPEFWHIWAGKLAPGEVAKASGRINALAETVGKGVVVRVEGETQARAEFAYDSKAKGAPAEVQDAIVGELLNAWLAYSPSAKQAVKSQGPRVTVEIKPDVDQSVGQAAREAALAYPGEIRRALQGRIDAKLFNLLEERYRHALVAEVNVFRDDKGYKPLDASPVLLAHPRLDLYVDVDSSHNMEQVGCTSCHDGSGQETNFVLAAHTPREIWVDSKTGVPVLPQQLVVTGSGGHGHDEDLSDLREVAFENATSLHFDALAKKDAKNGHDAHGSTKPAQDAAHHDDHGEGAYPRAVPTAGPVDYVDPVTGETRRAVPQAKYWKKHELESGTSFKDVNHYWDWPMRPPEYIQANCARCHSNVHDIKEEAPVLYEGRTLFVKNGCVNCHQMDSISAEELSFKDEKGELVRRRVGPDLRHVKDKLSPAFLHSWIWSPKAFRPSTNMPHFFMLENNSSDEEIRRTQQEVRAITHYLLATAKPAPQSSILTDPRNKMPESKEDELETRVERGRALFIGLTGAREGIPEMQGGVGCIACHTNLNETGLYWITTDLIKNGDLAEEMRLRTGKAPTAQQLSQEARKRYDAMSYNERQMYAMEHFSEGRVASSGEPSLAMTPAPNMPLPRYADGSLKPVFQQHGPELSGVGTKLLAGRDKAQARQFLYNWLMDPRHYSAYTTMPRLRLTPDEALDLSEYLLAQQRVSKSKDDTWQAKEIAADDAKVTDLVALFLRSQFSERDAPVRAADDGEMTRRAASVLKSKDVDAKKAEELAGKMSLQEKQLIFLGQKLITHYGCMNCHAINGVETAASPCANLSDWGQKALTKLDYGYLDHHHVESLSSNPASAKPGIPMVNGLSVDAVTKVTEHVNQKKWSEPIAQNAHVAWPHIDHTRESWLLAKLKNSRIYDRGKNLLEPVRQRDANGNVILDENQNPKLDKDLRGKPYDKLRMPTFYFTEGEVHAIATFVLSNRDKLVTPRLLARTNNTEANTIARGRQILEHYNCVSCHRTEGNEPPVQQYWTGELQAGNVKFTYFTKDDLSAKAPPSLRSQGARVQHAWLHHFLQNVGDEGTVQKEGEKERRKIRPQPFIRMPSFALTDEEATVIAAYFNAVSNKEARMHRKKLDVLFNELKKELEVPGQTVAIDVNTLWPAEDWYTQEKFAPVADYVREWALDHTPAKPNDFALSQPPEALAKSYMLALYDARYMAQAMEAKYPFVEQYRPNPSEERFKKGEQLFHILQCQTCHVLGDERNPGVLQAPKAPNFNLAHRRINSAWARDWVQEPQTIQPGNPMPAIFFSGRGIPALTDPARSIYRLHGLPHLTSSPTPELVKQIQHQFGNTAEEQIELVMEFIYAAGMRNYTSIDPPVGQPIALPTVPADAKLVPVPGVTGPLPDPPKKAAPTETKPEAPPAMEVASGPSVIGRVIYEGPTPAARGTRLSDAACAKHHPGGVLPSDELVVGKDKGLRYTVVTVKNPPKGRFAPPKDPAVLDQKGCRYEPHVLAMMTGQQILVKNSDPLLHNVHSLPDKNPSINFGQNGIDPGKPMPKLTQAEAFRVKCDVHPWMGAYFVAFDHPFFAATGEDGSFQINGLPPGTYTITTWHEKLPPVEQEVTVAAGKPAEVTLTLKPGE